LDTLPHERQIQEYVKTIEHLKKQNSANPIFHNEILKLEQKLQKMKEKIYSELTPWQRVQICRHPARPHTIDYIKNICKNFHELCGDRTFGDDHSIIGGLATIGNMKCIVVGQEKGNDTESRVHRNFGMLNPEGFRKALRLMHMAEKFNLPIVCFIDTPGAYAGLEAEERGQGWAIANNLRAMARISTPIIVAIIGEGCSGGALGMAIGDAIGMMEHAYYSVISPEACASILWKDSKKNVEAATILKLNSEDMLQFSIIDAIINEPLGGAHYNPEKAYANMQQFITEQWETLRNLPKDVLLEHRYLKFRKLGEYTINKNPVKHV
jgi:acetyl-CoA carboxylase carboxyl transferase subunit alpha